MENNKTAECMQNHIQLNSIGPERRGTHEASTNRKHVSPGIYDSHVITQGDMTAIIMPVTSKGTATQGHIFSLVFGATIITWLWEWKCNTQVCGFWILSILWTQKIKNLFCSHPQIEG